MSLLWDLKREWKKRLLISSFWLYVLANKNVIFPTEVSKVHFLVFWLSIISGFRGIWLQSLDCCSGCQLCSLAGIDRLLCSEWMLHSEMQASITPVVTSEIAASLGDQFCAGLETFQEADLEPAPSAFQKQCQHLISCAKAISFYKETRAQGENWLAQNYTSL